MKELETPNNFKEEDVEALEDKDNNEEDNGTGVEDFDGDGNGDGNGDKDTNTGVGYVGWLRFLSPKARTDALGTMAKAEASLSMS